MVFQHVCAQHRGTGRENGDVRIKRMVGVRRLFYLPHPKYLSPESQTPPLMSRALSDKAQLKYDAKAPPQFLRPDVTWGDENPYKLGKT